jgi:Protein of unknown function (DUF2442)
MHFVKEIQKTEPFKLHLKFEDGVVRVVDFEKRLALWSTSEQSIYKKLLNPEYFRQVKLNKELETIYWDNGIDFCPEVLFQWSENN